MGEISECIYHRCILSIKYRYLIKDTIAMLMLAFVIHSFSEIRVTLVKKWLYRNRQ